MPIMYATYGIPGCGKSYLGKAWRASRMDRQVFDRDSIREDLRLPPRGNDEQEARVTERLWRKVRNASQRRRDLWIACTNLGSEDLPRLAIWADHLDMAFVVVDFSTVPLVTCLRQNRERDRRVPEDVIRGMHAGMATPCPWDGVVVPWDAIAT